MKTAEEVIKIIKEHQAVLQEQFGITSMSLFGSVSRHEQREDSDVDLFASMPPKLYNYILAVQFLEELLECRVDLVQNHRNLRPFFKEQIEKDGINIFTANYCHFIQKYRGRL